MMPFTPNHIPEGKSVLLHLDLYDVLNIDEDMMNVLTLAKPKSIEKMLNDNRYVAVAICEEQSEENIFVETQNNINDAGSWSRNPATGIDVIGKGTKGNPELGYKSTSVGDLVLLSDGSIRIVATYGFKTLDVDIDISKMKCIDGTEFADLFLNRTSKPQM